MQALARTMEEHRVSGTEAMMGVMNFASNGFLGENIQKTWIKQNVKGQIGESEGRSAIVVNDPVGEEFYILNGETMQVETVSREMIISRFNAGKYEYRGSTHTIAAIDGEVPVPEDEIEGEKDDNVK